MRSIALFFAPILALVPAKLAAQPAVEIAERGSIKGKAPGTGPKSKRPIATSVHATARILRGVKLRLTKNGPDISSRRKFQLNLALNGRRMIEFE